MPNHSLLYLDFNYMNNFKEHFWRKKGYIYKYNCYENPQIMLVCEWLDMLRIFQSQKCLNFPMVLHGKKQRTDDLKAI